jgi:hypothetical protein
VPLPCPTSCLHPSQVRRTVPRNASTDRVPQFSRPGFRAIPSRCLRAWYQQRSDEYSISLEKKKDSEVRGLDLGMEIVRSTGREAVLRSTQSSSWRWQPPHLVWTAPALPHLDAAAVLFLDHVMFSLPRATGPCANASKDRWCSRFISYWEEMNPDIWSRAGEALYLEVFSAEASSCNQNLHLTAN